METIWSFMFGGLCFLATFFLGGFITYLFYRRLLNNQDEQLQTFLRTIIAQASVIGVAAPRPGIQQNRSFRRDDETEALIAVDEQGD